MKQEIIPIKTGFSNSFLIKENDKCILIDAGIKNHISIFQKKLSENNIKPHQIKLIVLTHSHYDHTGNIRELKKISGAKILVHQKEAQNLENGSTPIPNGTILPTKIIVSLGRIFRPNYAAPPAIKPDILNNTEFNLSLFGVDGKVIHTPGHTAGSQSVLIEKTLFSGDTFFNIRNKNMFPPFANDIPQLLKTWEKLFEMGIKTIYPSHGPSFSTEKIFPVYKKWKDKMK